MAEQYNSLKIIGDRILRNTTLSGISWESIIDYTVDFLDIVGVPDIYENRLYEAKIKDYRAELPCDFMEDNQVLIRACKGNSIHFIPARHATDTFHKHYACLTKRNQCGCGAERGINRPQDFTFSIQGFWIYTSVIEGDLKMDYRAIMTDEEGYPLIPSQRTFLNALERYIKWRYYEILWDEGKIEDKRLVKAETEYAWAVGQLETDFNRLSLSKAESFFNSFKHLIPRETEFSKRFIHNGHKEYIRNH